MNLAIFGATGGTGRHVVEQALAAGHEVTTLVRDPARVNLEHARLRVVPGSIQDRAAIETALDGAAVSASTPGSGLAEAVISTLGPRSNAPVFEISRGMENLVAVMRQCGVRRLVMSAGLGVPDPQDRPDLINRVIGGLLGLAAPNVAEDMRRAVIIVQTSGLDWTVLRAPRLVDRPAGRPLRYGYIGQGLGFELARADYAQALIAAATENQYLHQMPGVSN
jgi:putative NADH-flavin reductase